MSSTELCRVANRSTRDAGDIVSLQADALCRARCGRTRASASVGSCPKWRDFSEHRVGRTHQARLERDPNNLVAGLGVVRIAIEMRNRGTRRGHVQSSAMSLDTYPAPSRSFEVQSMKPASSAPALGRRLGRDTRGERRPSPRQTSTQSWSTSVPYGTSLPPRSSSRTEADGHPIGGPIVVRLAPTWSVRTCSAASRFRLLRAPRTGATLTPPSMRVGGVKLLLSPGRRNTEPPERPFTS